ncbi:MAG: [Fe-S]-binding protein, partial [Deltaproteobacteria bacterium]|nr:[Fe-S]-binding protein [Deltaproteobacteria bacterium]
MNFPQMYRIRQPFDKTAVQDIPGTVKAELQKLALGKLVKPGQRVALTAGSRGVANIAIILKAAVEYL